MENYEKNTTPEAETHATNPWTRPLAFVLAACALLAGLGWWINEPPTDFPATEITVTPGMSAAEVVDVVRQAGLVRSSDWLYVSLVVFYDPSNIKAGTYVFSEPITTRAVAEYLATTAPQDELVSVTFPEGFSVYEFDTYLPESIGITESEEALAEHEGYLFPDTYFVPIDYTVTQLVGLMSDTFNERIAGLMPTIEESRYTLEEVIILASIVEREANDKESMGYVSGILDNRLTIGMPLQVDASVAYGLDKPGTELTSEDMQLDGPYNTYTRPGLPPTPIANPGLTAIEAVLNPTPSEYLYYITGNDGNFYYAETLEEHNANIARYLR